MIRRQLVFFELFCATTLIITSFSCFMDETAHSSSYLLYFLLDIFLILFSYTYTESIPKSNFAPNILITTSLLILLFSDKIFRVRNLFSYRSSSKNALSRTQLLWTLLRWFPFLSDPQLYLILSQNEGELLWKKNITPITQLHRRFPLVAKSIGAEWISSSGGFLDVNYLW